MTKIEWMSTLSNVEKYEEDWKCPLASEKIKITREINKKLLLWNDDDRGQLERIAELSSRLENEAIGYRQAFKDEERVL